MSLAYYSKWLEGISVLYFAEDESAASGSSVDFNFLSLRLLLI